MKKAKYLKYQDIGIRNEDVHDYHNNGTLDVVMDLMFINNHNLCIA